MLLILVIEKSGKIVRLSKRLSRKSFVKTPTWVSNLFSRRPTFATESEQNYTVYDSDDDNDDQHLDHITFDLDGIYFLVLIIHVLILNLIIALLIIYDCIEYNI